MNPRFVPVRQPAGLAFDSIAERYDEMFTRSSIGRAQRNAVWDVARQTFGRGDYVLELNCGTGEDALFLARQGISMFACDASDRMIGVARRRCEVEGPDLPLWFETLPIEQIGELRSIGLFDGVFSNFSGLNCVGDIAQVASCLSTLVKLGGRLLLCLSTRICLWEALWFFGQGDFRRAVRRWKGRAAATLGGVEVEVHYPTLRELQTKFSPYFRLSSCRGIGVTVPPSYLEHIATKHERVLRSLRALDTVIATWPGFRLLGDHMLLCFERVPS
jgi:SAM-dependent methyltransferase